MKKNGMWRQRYNFEQNELYDEPDVLVHHLKVARLSCVGSVLQRSRNLCLESYLKDVDR